MIELAQFTGNHTEDGLVEVRLSFSVIRLAKPVFAFPLAGFPVKSWLDMYGKSFMAIVAPYDSKSGKLLLLGLVPVTKVENPESLATTTYILGTKSRVVINNSDGTISLDLLDAADAELLLGSSSTSAMEAAVLGDTLAKFLDDFVTAVSNITVTTMYGQSPILNKVDFIKLKETISEILSKKVKIVKNG